MRKRLLLVLMALLPMTVLITVTSCSKDEEVVQPQNGNETGNNDGDNNDGNNGQLDQEIVVTVDANGNADGGHIFTKIDESNFYIDDIKYTDVSGNLEVTGYNEAFFNGTATIISALKYEGRGTLKVAAIAERAFYNCTILKSIIISNGLTKIGNNTFDGYSSLTSITIPNSVTSIGRYAFRGCSSLTSVTIGNGVASIGNGAFYGCNSLTAVNITDLAAWCGISFESTIIYYADPEGFSCYCYDSNPLSYAKHLYLNGKEIKDLVILDNVTSIAPGAFNGCSGLKSIYVAEGNTKYDSRYNCNAIIETETNTLLWGCQNTIIPQNVTSIDDYAFYKCSGLTSITIPNSVTRIGEHAFRDCTNLTSVTIPNSVTSIGDFAFSNCSSLTSITIPNSVTTIDSRAFYECSSLTSITIPNSVTSIGYDAFYECSGLKYVYCYATNPPSAYYSFENTPISSATLHVPAGSVDAYKAREPWKNFGTIVAIQ